MTNIKYKKLLNGFQVIYEKPKSMLPITSIQIFCNIGNIHSPVTMRGVTHFIEHMCFEGTKEHPDFNKVLIDYKDMGVEYNGISTQRYTAYIIKCQDYYADKCIRLLSEELLNSTFDKSKFKKEEKVVMQENINDSDEPAYILKNNSNALLYENTPFQYPTDDVSYHTKEYDYVKVLDFYKQNYTPSNMILSITTNIPFSKIIHFIEKTHFNKRTKQCVSIHKSMLSYLMNPPIIHGVKYKVKIIPKLSSTYLNVSFQTCSQYDFKEMYILNLLSNILGSSLSSRLYKVLREKYGLVYYISTDTNYYECGGDFTFQTQFKCSSFIQKHEPSVLPLLIKELNDLNLHGITGSELKVAKHNMRSHLLLEMENIDSQTYYNGNQCLLYEKPQQIVPYIDIYKVYYAKITKAQIDACIRKYFCLKRMCVSIVGNHLPSLHLISEECNKLHNK